MNGASRNARVAITGLGLVTCVGRDVVTGAASVRAGIRRPAPLLLEEFDDAVNEAQPIMGYPLTGVADGYVGVGLYTRIASVALEDLFTGTGLDPQDPSLWLRSRLYLALSPFRSDTLGDFSDVLARALGPALQRRWTWQLPERAVVTVVSGNTACLNACQSAFDALASGEIDRAVVVAVDSLVGEEELNFLFSRGRLKTFDRPSGLMPGEAGAALLLESAAAVQARGATVQAWLGRPVCVGALRADETGETGDDRRDTELWSRNVAAALTAAARSGPGALTIYTDVNGEDWRASVWGTGMAAMTGDIDWQASKVVIPAVVLGDTGAASGGVALCLATRAYARGYAASPGALPGGTVVVSTGEQGDAAAVALSPAS